MESPSSSAIVFSISRSCVEGREIKWEKEKDLIIYASMFISRLLNIPVVSVTYDWSDVTLDFTSIEKEPKRQATIVQLLSCCKIIII